MHFRINANETFTQTNAHVQNHALHIAILTTHHIHIWTETYESIPICIKISLLNIAPWT